MLKIYLPNMKCLFRRQVRLPYPGFSLTYVEMVSCLCKKYLTHKFTMRWGMGIKDEHSLVVCHLFKKS